MVKLNPSNSGNRRPSIQVDAEIYKLLKEVKEHPSNSAGRRKNRTEILRIMHQDLLCDCHGAYEHEDLYSAVRLNVIEYFFKYAWDSPDPTIKPFCDPNCKIIHRLRVRMKFQIKGEFQKLRKEEKLFYRCPKNEEDSNPIENLQVNDEPKIRSKQGLTSFLIAVNSDPKLEKTVTKKRIDITAKKLIVANLLDAFSFKELSSLWNIKYSTLTTFYARHCKPWIDEWVKENPFNNFIHQ
jgi:hypothetical protein